MHDHLNIKHFTHNKKLPKNDASTSKHVAVLQETDIVNIYFPLVGQK